MTVGVNDYGTCSVQMKSSVLSKFMCSIIAPENTFLADVSCLDPLVRGLQMLLSITSHPV